MSGPFHSLSISGSGMDVYQTWLDAIADNVAMLHDGKIRWTGPVADMDDAGDPYLTQFISGNADGPIEAVR